MTRQSETAAVMSTHGRAPAGRGSLPPPGSRVHFVGVAGAGMRGLAFLMAKSGYEVSGCDRDEAAELGELSSLGICLDHGHDASHVEDVQLVIYSSAVPPDSPELEAAREADVPMLKRARAMGAVVNSHRLVGVAGTHGKTTITAMTGLLCEAAGLDPNVLVGGRVTAWDGYARHGRGVVSVAEADEYDRSFLELDPWLALVSSLEAEHLDTYGDFDALRAAYKDFASRALERGGVLFCQDDPGARELGRALGSALSYGFHPDSLYRIEMEAAAPHEQRARLAGPDGSVRFRLGVPGRHNVQNAAAALSIALILGAEPAVADRLLDFRGVGRRLEEVAETGEIHVVDDYAHHPTEVRASLEALRARHPGARLVVFFQPHLYSRTRAFAPEFARALQAADEAYLLPIYPAREAPIEGVTSDLIVQAGGTSLQTCSKDESIELVRAAGSAGPAVFVFMGAGDVTSLAREAATVVTDAALGA